MKLYDFIKPALLVLMTPTLAFATNYSETNNGDISGNRNAPTAFNLAMGANVLTATTGANDQEYLKVVVPANHILSSITLNSYSGASKSFIGFQNGATFTKDPMNTAAADMKGYALFGTSATANVKVNGNVLVAMKSGAGVQGFTIPLAANTYTFWLQETAGNVTYSMTFNVQSTMNVQAPVIAPDGGSYFDSVKVTMTSMTAGATIYYTTDGNTPTMASNLYAASFTLQNSAVVKAYAIKNGSNDSVVTMETYDITPSPLPPASTLTVSGKKSLKTTKTSIKIKGLATNATSVEYRVGKGAFKPASGTMAWIAKPKLKPGKNVIIVQAKGKGSSSAPVKVTVTRK